MSSYYDPRTDEIHGCVNGSYAWFHEMRHREQYKRGVGERADRLYVWGYYAAFISGTVGAVYLGPYGFFTGIGMALCPHLFALVYLEGDAYLVGSWRWLRWKWRFV